MNKANFSLLVRFRLVLWSAVIISLLGGLLLAPFSALPLQAATFNLADGDIAGLKAALTAPNPPHIINLAANGTYTLNTIDNNTTFGATGLPIIDRDITINGNGATISRAGGGATPQFRLFYIVSTGKLTLNNLTLSNGNDASAYGGGAIFNQGGTLSVTNSTFSANSTILGGGAIANVAKGGTGTAGGTGAAVTATLTVTNSTFSANSSAGFGGGAIYNAASGGNTGGSGTAGGAASAQATLSNSTFVANQALLVGNTASSGGAIFNGAENGQGNQGGAGSANLTVANSTFWSNQSAGSGGALINLNLGSAGATNVSAIVNLTNATLANNSAGNNNGGGIVTGTFLGSLPASVTLRNSLLASNSGGNCLSAGTSFGAGVANLEYTGSAGAASCGSGSTLTQTNPLSAAGLANNGGLTQTVALASSPNPALDQGDSASCAAAPVNNLDQRGQPRPSGTGCDIGAFELQVSGCSPTSVVSSKLDDGSCGTLRVVVGGISNGTISFNLTSPKVITLNGSGLSLPVGVKLQAGCSGGVPEVTISGGGLSGPGLTLNGGNDLSGLKLSGFVGRELRALKGGNKLKCVVVSRS